MHNYGIDTSQLINKNYCMTQLSTTHVATDDSTTMIQASICNDTGFLSPCIVSFFLYCNIMDKKTHDQSLKCREELPKSVFVLVVINLSTSI